MLELIKRAAAIGACLLAFGCTGQNAASDPGQIQCGNSEQCPPGCDCVSAEGLSIGLCDPVDTCRGSCTRNSCPVGSSCVLGDDEYACQPDSGTVGAPCDTADDCNASLECAGGFCQVPTPECPFEINGVATDDMGETLTDMFVIATPREGGSGNSTSSDENGEYALPLTMAADAEVFVVGAQVVDGQRFLTAEGSDSVTVSCGGSERYDIDATRGYYLEVQSVGRLSGASGGSAVLPELDYTIWNRERAPNNGPRIVIGFEGTYVIQISVPGVTTYDPINGNSGTQMETAIDVPDLEAGVYGIYAFLWPGPFGEDGEESIVAYESRFEGQRDRRYIPIGEFEVVSAAP